jgi:hypothetical protein
MDPRIEHAILLITTRFRESLALPDLAAEVKPQGRRQLAQLNYLRPL